MPPDTFGARERALNVLRYQPVGHTIINAFDFP